MAQLTTPSNAATRSETDSFGPIDVAADRYWGAQTERSRQNFKIGHDRMPIAIIHALAIVKLAAAETNRELGQLDVELADRKRAVDDSWDRVAKAKQALEDIRQLVSQ